MVCMNENLFSLFSVNMVISFNILLCNILEHFDHFEILSVTIMPETVFLSRLHNAEWPTNMNANYNSQNTEWATNLTTKYFTKNPSQTLLPLCSPSFWLKTPWLNYSPSLCIRIHLPAARCKVYAQCLIPGYAKLSVSLLLCLWLWLHFWFMSLSYAQVTHFAYYLTSACWLWFTAPHFGFFLLLQLSLSQLLDTETIIFTEYYSLNKKILMETCKQTQTQSMLCM